MSFPVKHLRDVNPRPGYANWERRRHSNFHWFIECFAEFLGVFFYVYAGVGSTAGFVLGNLLKEGGLSSLLQIGFAYAFGILMALCVCAATSGGHFSPGVTIMFVIFKRFPKLKAVRYVIAQILGAYVACLVVYLQYKHLITGIEHSFGQRGLPPYQFTPQSTPGILALYVLPGSSLGQVFLNEFVSSFLLGLVIWACLDHSNVIIPPAFAPWVISFAYAAIIWGYAPVGVGLNTARDVGGRLAALSIYGTKAAGGSYAAIAALTNVPAMVLAAFVYEVFLTDSDRAISRDHLEFIAVHQNHARNPATSGHTTAHSHPSNSMEKADISTVEKV
jgi:glycerol uptake facilitator-like aquaporin